MSSPTPRTLTELPDLTILDSAPSSTDILLVRQGGVDKKMSANLLPGANSTSDVSSPNPSDDNALVRYDGITGKIIQNSNALLDDAGNLSLSSPLSEISGGTGENSYAVGDLLYSSAINTLSKLAAGSDNNVLTISAGIPTWSPPAASGTITSVSGTTDRLTSTGGTDPILDIAPTYAGQDTIDTLGTVTSGTWNGTAIDESHGGTNQTTYVTGDLLYASGANTLDKLPIGSTDQVLTIVAGVPTWTTGIAGDVESVSGTAGRITSTGGANPKIDLDTSYIADMSQGGTNANLTPINNGILYSTATSAAILPSANQGVLTTSETGVPSIDTTNFHVLPTGVQIKGNNAGTAPLTGFIGEQIRSYTAKPGIAIASNIIYNISSITLNPGTYLISSILNFTSNPSANVYLISITSTIITDLEADNTVIFPFFNNSGFDLTLTISSYVLNVTSTSTVYATAYSYFTTGSMNAYGKISAIRIG